MTKQVSVTLSDQDLQALEDLSRSTGRSISTLIREAVKKYLREVARVGLPDDTRRYSDT